MLSVNLYNPYREDKLNLLCRPKFDKVLVFTRAENTWLVLLISMYRIINPHSCPCEQGLKYMLFVSMCLSVTKAHTMWQSLLLPKITIFAVHNYLHFNIGIS